MVRNKQEWFLEIITDILHLLLSQLCELVKDQEEQIVWHNHKIFDNFDCCIQMLQPQHFGLSLVEKASQCLIQMLQIYAQSKLR